MKITLIAGAALFHKSNPISRAIERAQADGHKFRVSIGGKLEKFRSYVMDEPQKELCMSC